MTTSSRSVAFIESVAGVSSVVISLTLLYLKLYDGVVVAADTNPTEPTVFLAFKSVDPHSPEKDVKITYRCLQICFHGNIIN